MRTLSATLQAAQKQHITEPAAQVVIDDRHVGVFRPRWQLYIADTVATGPAVAAATYDGGIIRARLDPTDGTLYVQRISDPANTSQWTSWTALESAVSPAAQLALAWDGNTVQALFFVAADGRTIRMRQSSDNGQTWSAAATVATLADGHLCRSLAASLNAGSGTLYCFFADEIADTQAAIYTAWRPESGGDWSTPQSWGRDPVQSTYGLAVDGTGPCFNVAAGLDHSLCTFDVSPAALGSWPEGTPVLRSDNPAISYRWPSVALGLGQHYNLFFVEHNTATNGARLNHVVMPNWNHVSIFPRPYQMTAPYGASCTSDVAYHYLCSACRVYRAVRWGPDGGQRVNVSGDVGALRLGEYLERPGRLTLWLRNDDGRYAGAGATGPYQAIRQGSQVSVRLGYRTEAGEEVSYHRPYWITRMTWQVRRGAGAPAATLTIEAGDGWGILQATPARQAYLWTNVTVLHILTALLAGLGFAVTDDGDPAWSRPVARFAINPGVSLAEAVRRLLRLAGGHLIFRSDAEWEETWPSAVAHLAVSAAADAYTFGSGHAVIAADNGLNEQDATHVIVLGNGALWGEALDWEMIELGNDDRLRSIVDRRLQTVAEAEQRAEAELAVWQHGAQGGWLVVAPNVGQEVLDVITINDAAAHFANDERLVVGNEIVLDRARGIFEQKLELAAV